MGAAAAGACGVNLTPTPPLPRGCTVCDTQDTATVDGIHGRRCAAHPPTFDPAHAVNLMVRGLPGAALAYVRSAA
jgi:hypothetical protein